MFAMMTAKRKPLGYAIIGCGRIFQNHLAGVRQCAHARLVAVCDVDEARRTTAASIPEAPIALENYRSILERDDVDIVDICLPHYLHYPAVMESADAGKHILCEKPIATRLVDALQMIERTANRGVSFGIVYQNRYNTASVKVKRALEAGRFGTVVAASCSMNNSKPQSYYQDAWHGRLELEGGGTLTTQAVHNLDLLCWFLGQPISIMAHAGVLTHCAEVEDTAACTIEFAGGALAAFMSTNSSYLPWNQRMEICGTLGNVVIEDNRITRWAFSERSDPDDGYGGEDADSVLPGSPGYGPSHPRLIADFVTSVYEGRPFCLNGREALTVSLLLWAIYQSAKSGRREKVDAPFEKARGMSSP
jgi:UDP-N-acetyl-2-amino-2-deoxyglucuronate dehydrogenase